VVAALASLRERLVVVFPPVDRAVVGDADEQRAAEIAVEEPGDRLDDPAEVDRLVSELVDDANEDANELVWAAEDLELNQAQAAGRPTAGPPATGSGSATAWLPLTSTGSSTSASRSELTAGPSSNNPTALGPVKEGRLYGTKATCVAGSTLKHRLFGRT
jgi:hypothetical protein